MAAFSSAGARNAAPQTDISVESGGRDLDDDVANASIARLQRLMGAGQLATRDLVDIYLHRIRAIDNDLDLTSVLELNPEARRIANELDRERHRYGARGPLHGIPILLKDNIDTADRMARAPAP